MAVLLLKQRVALLWDPSALDTPPSLAEETVNVLAVRFTYPNNQADLSRPLSTSTNMYGGPDTASHHMQREGGVLRWSMEGYV